MFKRFLFVLLSIFVISTLVFSESSETSNLSEWRMSGRYLNHTAWDGISFGLIQNLNAANFTNGVPFTSSPAIANGFVYVGDDNGVLHQLNASNVSVEVANFTTGSNISASITVADGFVYVGTTNNILYQLNASNVSGSSSNSSTFIANFTTGGGIYGGVAVANGFVYLGSQDTHLYQLNSSNISQQIANFTASGTIDSVPAIADGFVYFGDGDGFFYQLNSTNVSVQFENLSIGSSFSTSSAAVSGGFVYVAGGNILYQLNSSNVSSDNGNPFATFSTGNSIYSSPAVANGFVYITSSDANLYQLNSSNISGSIGTPGSYFAVFSSDDSISSSPTIANGFVYFGGSNNVSYQLNASNVSLPEISSFTTSGSISSSAAFANGYIYFGSSDHYFYQRNSSNLSLLDFYVSIHFTGSTPSNHSTFGGHQVQINVSSVSYPQNHYILTDFNRSLKLYLTMDNFSSGSPVDVSSYSRSIVNSGTSQTNLGFWGKGLTFGSETYLTLTRPIKDNFTICAWIKTTSAGYEDLHWRTSPIMESESPNPDNDFGFGVGYNGTLVFGHGDYLLDSDFVLVGNTTVNDGEWHFACATRNQSSTAMSVYVDGSFDGSANGSNASLDSNPDAIIGFGTDGAKEFIGTMDDLFVFDRVLSSQEILSLYDASSNPYSQVFDSLEDDDYTFNSYLVNSFGIFTSEQLRFFTISNVAPPTTASDVKQKIKISLSSFCKNNNVSISAPSASFSVIDEDTGSIIYAGSTNENGFSSFLACSKSVRIYASKEGYRPSTEFFTLDSCGCSDSNPPVVQAEIPPSSILVDSVSNETVPADSSPLIPSLIGPQNSLVGQAVSFEIENCLDCVVLVTLPSGSIISLIPSSGSISFDISHEGTYLVSLLDGEKVVGTSSLVASSSADSTPSSDLHLTSKSSFDPLSLIIVVLIILAIIFIFYFILRRR